MGGTGLMSSKLELYGLPADVDCETFVIGAVLKNYSLYHPQVADIVSAADFSLESHKIIWRVIELLISEGIAVDRVTVFKALAEKCEIEKIGGLSYLIGLDDGIPPVPNVATYAVRVREKATLRDGVLAAQSIIERLCSSGAGSADIVAAEKLIRRVAESQIKERRLVSIGDVIAGNIEGDNTAAQSFLNPAAEQNGVRTPWEWLNRNTGGFRPGNLVILAARPSVGKTSAAVQMVLSLADLEIGAVFVSLEMSKRDITRKIVAAKAGVSLQDWQNNTLSAEERTAVRRAAVAIRPAELFLDDQPRATVPGIHAAILRHQADHDCRLVVIDYLQLLTPTSRGSNKTEDISEMTRGLKIMAMELGVPVIALSQLSRASEKERRRPRLDDLRDSGSIEQDADIVLFLHRVEKPCVELIMAKQRLGPIGEVRMIFDRRTGLFSEAGENYEAH